LLFPSLQFALFLTVLLALMFIFRRTGPRKLILLGASWLFYMAWNPLFIWLLLATSLVDYWAAARMERYLDNRPRKLLLILSLAFNLSLLAYFKYAGFLSSSLLYLFREAGVPLNWELWEITLPVGISFYTFQSMSYTIDVYRRQLRPAASLLDYMLFISYFPHLVAGPILRAIDFLPQLCRPVQLFCDAQCLLLICNGLVKKVLVADNIAPFVDEVMRAPATYTSLTIWLAAFSFGVQVYCDFSGYSEIAIGLGRLFGYVIPPNFNRPLTSRNPREFWQRSHISLSRWLRDYLFIPLGGSRHGEWATARNVMITMLLGGLWHGASWNFVLWGGWHGILLLGHRYYSRLIAGSTVMSSFGRSIPGQLLSWGGFHYVLLISWLMFRVVGTRNLFDALHKFLFFDGQARLNLSNKVDLAFTMAVLGCFCMLHLCERWWGLKQRLLGWNRAWLWLYLALCTLLLALFWPSRSEPFIYFQF
jgi:alginate O-acetyltransferase complex protein AlgI